MLLVDVLINTILFIVQKDTYVEWCITSASNPLNSQLLGVNQGKQQQFNFAVKDFYNCSRIWEDELKFTILCAALIVILYVSYFFFSSCQIILTIPTLVILDFLLILVCDQASNQH